jgi:hypothetical protein
MVAHIRCNGSHIFLDIQLTDCSCKMNLPCYINIRSHIRSEVFTVVTMKNAVSWNVMLCVSCKNIALLYSVRWLLVTANVVPSSRILVTLMMGALHSSKISVLTKSHAAYHPRRWHSSSALTLNLHPFLTFKWQNAYSHKK